MINPATARAATWTVTKIADTADGACDADCSLREAVHAARRGDRIVFLGPFPSPLTITLTRGTLRIRRDLTIVGPGASWLTIDANYGNGPTAIDIRGGADVTLSGMTITGAHSAPFGVTVSAGIVNHGRVTIADCVVTGNFQGIANHGASMIIESTTVSDNGGGYEDAGGVFSDAGDLSVLNSTVSGNSGGSVLHAGAAGGIAVGTSRTVGTLTVVNSTISGNDASPQYGAINFAGGIWTNALSTTILNSTITGNSTTGIASGVLAADLDHTNNSVTVGNTIIAGNLSNVSYEDVALDPTAPGRFHSDGFNLIGNPGTVTAFHRSSDQTGSAAGPLDPRLEPLASNGGPTQTHKLLDISSAVDAGNSFGYTTDQRGARRPWDKPWVPNVAGGDGSDIGAYESALLAVIVGHVFGPGWALHALAEARIIWQLIDGRTGRAQTDQAGNFRIEPLPRDSTIRLTVTHPQFTFEPQLIQTGSDDVIDVTFIAKGRKQ